MMNRRLLGRVALVAGTVLALGLPMVSMAADETPDALIKRLSVDVLNTVRGDKAIQAGDINKVIALVDKTVMPNVNFRRMTAAAGPAGVRPRPSSKSACRKSS